MSILDPAVIAALESGHISRIDLIRIDLPGRDPVGYHRGGRPFPYNGLTYLPNRFLQYGDMRSATGVSVTSRTIRFSNIPVANPADAMAIVEQYDYPNAPVIISHLLGVPNSDQVLGVLTSSFYEIDKIIYDTGAADENGTRTLSLTIELQPPGRSARGQTLIKRSTADQQFDNDPTDTGLECVATVSTIPEEWGQVSR
ncbi:DUF2163 domain-containing protein [Sinorhizobium sp. A49]|uniref:DUF2163 domain-containing protein n=1 Tax=Sinorhizobium sp. A49 TaxID=1945861 RepID=UPI0009850A64|nr:DUF2163 domain-containing protein [Sinorhizobium sp. A49]OOG61993.1 DUF2163 domain-containing protein [Sinorhizobium sp. A49]